MNPAHFLAALIIALGAAISARAQDLPDAIKDLAPVYDQQAEFVEGLRAWGKAQIILAEAELEEAKELARARKQDESKAKKLSLEARIKSVKEAYEFGLKKYANDAKLQNAYGELLYDQFGQNDGAIRAWNLAISIDPKYAPPYNNLGLDQCHTGSYELGIKNLEKALDLEPKNPDFMFNIAQIYLVNTPQIEKIKKLKPKKIYERAMKLSKAAAELAPDDYELAEDYAVNFFAAENFKVEADWAEAAGAWARARPLAKRADRTFYTWLNEARCWIRAEKPDMARPCLEEALKIVPDSGPAKQLLEGLSQPTEPQKDAKTPGKRGKQKDK